MEVKHNERSIMHEEDKAYVEWLEGQEGAYQTKCRDAFLMFVDFLAEKEGWESPTGDKILARHIINQQNPDKKVKHYFADLMPKFHSWLKTEYESPRNGEPLSHNSASVTVTPVMGFFAFHRESLELTTAGRAKIAPVEVAKKYHAFKPEELSKMARVADVAEKPVILLGACEGVRVGDFVEQLRKPIIQAFKDQGEFPLEFQMETEKEGVVAVSHITEECWQALQDYWATEPDSEYVFPSNGSYISKDRANDVLKNTWLRAYPDREDARIRFHELRSYKMSVLSNAGVNKWHIKRMIGKKLSPDILEYLTGIDLRADFLKAYSDFNLLGLAPSNHEAVEQLVQTTTDLTNQMQNIGEVVKALSAENVELKQRLRESRKEAVSELDKTKAEFAGLIMDLAKFMDENEIGLLDAIEQLYLTTKGPGKWDAEWGVKPLSEHLRELLPNRPKMDQK